MGKRRPTGQKYQLSSLKVELFRHFFRTMYNENELICPKTISQSVYYSLPFEETIKWSPFDIVPDEDYKEQKPRKTWNNTIKGLTEDMKYSPLGMLERMQKQNSIYAIGTKEPKINQDNVRSAVEELVDEKLLVRLTAAHNQYAYYPNESLEGFRAFIEWVLERFKDYPLKFAIPMGTTYYNLMLNRQLILEVLKECNVKFSFTITSSEGEKHIITAPAAGRFRKIFEMGPEIDWYLDSLEELNEYLHKSETVSVSRIFEMLYDPEFIDATREDATIDDTNTLETMRAFLDGLCEHLEKCKNLMDNIAKNADDGVFDERFTPRDVFSKDSGFVFRREAMWEDMILTAEDLEGATMIHGDSMACSLSDEVLNAVIDIYPSLLEEHVILPVLCLVEMSPCAMKRFFLKPEAIKDQVFSLDHRSFWADGEVPGEPVKNEDCTAALHAGFAVELDKLMSEALKDYVNIDTLYPANEHYVHPGLSKTCLYRTGDVMSGNEVLPALFTFRINDGRYLSIYHSLPFEPTIGIKLNDCIKGPEGIKRTMLPTYMHGQMWKTPDWLGEIYEFYANKFKKSHMNTLDIHEMFNPESVDNRMEWFIELLRHNIHVDKSLIPE